MTPDFEFLLPPLDDTFPDGVWTFSVSRALFRCAGCGTEVERGASGYLDARGWTHCWQPRIVDADGRTFCSEMCGHRFARRQGWDR